ncbi:MAG: sulfatase-like hydrolase/transferase, partial [Planctomycetota bacterium]
YIPTNAPHGPFWVPQDAIDKMQKLVDAAMPNLPQTAKASEHSLVRYLAMIWNIDQSIGRLEAFLKQNNLRDNTILIFATDNGSTFGERYYPAGMRGRKVQLWEGGHRVPCFIRWPEGGLGQPRDISGLTQTQDLLPTLIDLCSLSTHDAPRFDGISLAPLFRSGATEAPAERMLVVNYSRMPGPLDYPSPDSPSIMRREGAAVLYKRWRLLEDNQLYHLDSDPLQQENVIDKHPEIVEIMRGRLDDWWNDVKEIANEPQRVVIGHDAENPMMLTGCEWLDVFVDQQRQILRGTLKNGYWELEVAQAGEYELELRRWPRESGLALAEGTPAGDYRAGPKPAGRALPIEGATILIDGQRMSKKAAPNAKAVRFTVRLDAGPARLHTWFNDDIGEGMLGAYYVYVNRK